jgi:hypothetical protein
MSEQRITRRDVLRKAAYLTPVILTLMAAPSFASGGSGNDQRDNNDWSSGNDQINRRDRRQDSHRRKLRSWD